jgi:hypothetical protein
LSFAKSGTVGSIKVKRRIYNVFCCYYFYVSSSIVNVQDYNYYEKCLIYGSVPSRFPVFLLVICSAFGMGRYLTTIKISRATVGHGGLSSSILFSSFPECVLHIVERQGHDIRTGLKWNYWIGHLGEGPAALH